MQKPHSVEPNLGFLVDQQICFFNKEDKLNFGRYCSITDLVLYV